MSDVGVVGFLQTRLALFFCLQRAYAAPPVADSVSILYDTARAYGAVMELNLGTQLLDVGSEEEPEFNRLFVGPGKLVAPPYESVYLSPDAMIMQEETAAVRAFYRAHGLEVRPGSTEPDDGLPLELEFYGQLQQRMLTAFESGDQAEAVRLLQAQRTFLNEHLDRWVGPFAERVRNGSSNPFYRSLANMLREVVGAERQAIAAIASVLEDKEE